jgi:hypothetical protein
MNYNRIVFEIRNRGVGVWSRGPLHSIDPHGLMALRCPGLAGASAHERFRPRDLAVRGPRGRGEWSGPHRGWRRAMDC